MNIIIQISITEIRLAMWRVYLPVKYGVSFNRLSCLSSPGAGY